MFPSLCYNSRYASSVTFVMPLIALHLPGKLLSVIERTRQQHLIQPCVAVSAALFHNIPLPRQPLAPICPSAVWLSRI